MGSPNYTMKDVLLADDDRDHSILFRIVLRQIDPSKHLYVIKNSGELLEYLAHQIPDLLFLDLNMPNKDGFECLEEIRKHPHLQNLPIVVYSSSSQMPDIKRSFVHKADLYLVKPFNSAYLRNALESILKMDWIRSSPAQKFYFMNDRFVPFTD